MAEETPKKNTCMRNTSGLLSTLLILITGYVIYTYYADTKEEADSGLVAITLLMNIGGSLYSLVTISVNNYRLYVKLRYGLYALVGIFTLCVVIYCFVIISRNKNFDDLVALIICFVIYIGAFILASRLYDVQIDTPTSTPPASNTLLPKP